jgi:hypothetical protein
MPKAAALPRRREARRVRSIGPAATREVYAGRRRVCGTHVWMVVADSPAMTYTTSANHPVGTRLHSRMSPGQGPGSSTGPITQQCRT